jgi:hypothetical protein
VIAKHRQAALRFGFGRVILQDIPVFSEAALFDPDNIRRDPRKASPAYLWRYSNIP